MRVLWPRWRDPGQGKSSVLNMVKEQLVSGITTGLFGSGRWPDVLGRLVGPLLKEHQERGYRAWVCRCRGREG
jgi:hypothetical protein